MRYRETEAEFKSVSRLEAQSKLTDLLLITIPCGFFRSRPPLLLVALVAEFLIVEVKQCWNRNFRKINLIPIWFCSTAFREFSRWLGLWKGSREDLVKEMVCVKTKPFSSKRDWQSIYDRPSHSIRSGLVVIEQTSNTKYTAKQVWRSSMKIRNSVSRIRDWDKISDVPGVLNGFSGYNGKCLTSSRLTGPNISKKTKNWVTRDSYRVWGRKRNDSGFSLVCWTSPDIEDR